MLNLRLEDRICTQVCRSQIITVDGRCARKGDGEFPKEVLDSIELVEAMTWYSTLVEERAMVFFFLELQLMGLVMRVGFLVMWVPLHKKMVKGHQFLLVQP